MCTHPNNQSKSEHQCWLQTARYLVKRLLAAQAGQGSPGGSAGYTANAAAELRQRCPAQSARDWLDPAVQSAAFRYQSCCPAASPVNAQGQAKDSHLFQTVSE